MRGRFQVADDSSTNVECERVFARLHGEFFGEEAPTKVGRFALRERLGAGAMGIVYSAYDPTLDREVALKLIAVPSGDAAALERVEREARALARLRHPNVVTIYEVGSHGDDRFIAMDLVRGETLRAWMTEGQTWRQRMEVLCQSGQGLAAAHDAGIIHRDFKPDNVLVEQGHARVVDFGLARAEPATAEQDADHGWEPSGNAVTRTGLVLGTPAYMAPEAFQGVADTRTDQFAYCVTIFEALYGERPFVATTVGAQLEAMRAARVSPGQVDLGAPQWLRRAVLRGLSFSPDDRWPDMHTLLAELERFRPGRYRKVWIAAGVGGAAVGVVVAATSSWREDSVCRDAAKRMTRVWSPAIARTTAEAFSATGVPFAEDTWQRASPLLDAYAQSWATMRRATCEAAIERVEQSNVLMDIKVRCLDRRVEEFAALVHAFGDPDREVVEHSVAAAHDLQPVSDCGNARMLQAQIAQSAAGEFPRAPQAQYEQLAQAKTALRMGSYAQGASDAAALAEDADTDGFMELAAGAYHVVAVAEDHLDHVELAESAAMQAIERAEQIGDDAARASAQSVLVSVLGKRRSIDAALAWARLTRATVARLGDPPELLAGLTSNEANVLTYAGRYEDALVKRRRALELRLQTLPPQDVRVAVARLSTAATLRRMGHAKEAGVEAKFAVSALTAALGQHHPDVARAHLALSDALQEQGEIPQAIAEAQRCVELGTVAFGPEHSFVGRAEVTLAVALAQSAEPKASLPHFARAIAVVEKTKGPDSILLSAALANYGRVLAHISGHEAEAIQVLNRALEIQSRRLGEDHVEGIFMLNSLATLYGRMGNHAEAKATSLRAIAVGKGFANGHPTVAQAFVQLGGAQAALGDLSGAIESFQTARKQFDEFGARPAQVAVAWIGEAKAHHSAGTMDRAEAAVRQAQQALNRAAEPPAAETEWVQAWLAEHASR